jgi:hypothetical protein
MLYQLNPTQVKINVNYILIENQQIHRNDHVIVMSSQTLLHVSAY